MWNRSNATGIGGAIAVAFAATGLAGFALLHVVMAATVDPRRQPVSSYALAEPGTTLFGIGGLCLATACAILAVSGRRLPRPVRVLLLPTAVMFVLVVVFRTDAGDEVSSIAGQIHRYAAGAAFILLTAVGIGMVRGGDEAVHARTLRLLTTVSAVTLAVTSLNTLLPELADGGQWRGLPQRVLLVVQSLLIIVMARRGDHCRPAARRGRADAPAIAKVGTMAAVGPGREIRMATSIVPEPTSSAGDIASYQPQLEHAANRHGVTPAG